MQSDLLDLSAFVAAAYGPDGSRLLAARRLFRKAVAKLQPAVEGARAPEHPHAPPAPSTMGEPTYVTQVVCFSSL
jgi:hypothetical protein